MGKRHRAQDRAKSSDFLNSATPSPAAPAHTLTPKSVNDFSSDGKHASEPPATGGAKPQGLSSTPNAKKTKKEKQRSMNNFGSFAVAADAMPSNGAGKGVDPLPKHASEGSSVDLDGQMWKKNGVKRKAGKSVDEIDGSKALKKKKKKALGTEDSSKNLNFKCEDRVTGQLPFDSSPSSEKVLSSLDKGAGAEPSGLEIYWKLSSTDAAVREVASMALVRELRAAQEVYEATGEDSQKGGDQVLLGAARESDGLEECAPGVRYALRRLVRGVASSHESARQGFALALTMVIGVLHCVKGAAIMQIIEKNLEATSSAKGQEAREGLLGRLFAYGAMVRSKVLFADVNGFDKDLLKEITEQLLTLAKKKSFLREPAVSVLLDLADQLPLDLLETSICAAPAFREWIKVGPESGGADVLFLAVKFWQKLPATISRACPFLPNSGNTLELFDAHHISMILPYLEEASFCHPRVHSIWPLLFQILLPDDGEKNATTTIEVSKKKKKHRKGNECEVLESISCRDALARFWSVVVDGCLLISSHARKHLALNLLMLILPKLPTEFIKIVFSNTLIRCLLDVLASKDTLLFKCVQLCLHELCKWAETDDKRIIGVVVSLQQTSFGKFDSLSKTFTIKSLISKITSQGIESMIHKLEAMFCKDIAAACAKAEANSSGRSFDNEVEMLKMEGGEETSEEKGNTVAEKNIFANNLWILNLICSLCKQAQLDFAKKATLQIEVGKFLLCQAVFDSAVFGKLAPQKMHKAIRWPLLPIPMLLKNRCISHLQSLLAENQQLLVAQKLNKKRLGELDEGSGEIEDLGVCLLQFYLELQQLSSISLIKTPSKEETEIVLKLTTAISEISLAVQTVDGEQREKLRAMHSLLVQVVLQSWLDPGWDIDIASELLISCKHLFGDLVSLDLGNIEEDLSKSPPSIEVIVDLVVSILTKSSSPLRGAAEKVFRCFTGDITVSSLRGMLQVIKKQPLAARHKVSNPLDAEDNDDDDLLGFEEDDSGDEEDTLSDLDRKEVNLEDLPLTDAEPVHAKSNTRLPKTIDKSTSSSKNEKFDTDKSMPQKGLQDGSDLDDSDLSDLDDDAMFRIDAHLAQIFKHKKKDLANDSVEGKGADVQLSQLKFRILGLLEIFLQKHSTSPLVLVIVPSLLQAFVIASATGSSQLADRVASILQNKVFKAKHYVKASDVDLATVKNILDRAWKLASRSANKKVGSLAQACWIWMLKVIHGSFSSEVDRELLEVVTAAIEDYFNQKKCRLPPSFFVDTFTRQSWTGRLLIERLIDKCISARSEFLQCEAMRLTAMVLNPKSRISKDPAALPDDGWKHMGEPLLPYVERIGNMMLTVFEKPFKKASKQTEAVRFCIVFCEAFPLIYSQKSLAEVINTELLLSAVKRFEAPGKGKLRSLVSKFQQCLEAALVASLCLRKNGKAVNNANPSQPLESVGIPKKKKKPKLNI